MKIELNMFCKCKNVGIHYIFKLSSFIEMSELQIRKRHTEKVLSFTGKSQISTVRAVLGSNYEPEAALSSPVRA